LSRHAAGWPATLSHGEVTVRPLRWRDVASWVEARTRNADWLREWEATPPGAAAYVPSSVATFVVMIRRLHRDAHAGRTYPFAVLVGGRFAGQLNVGGIVHGSLHSAHLGYWIDERYAGRGAMTTAVALVTDHCFTAIGLHRVDVNIRPENAASRRVVEKLGFRDEGVRREFLHIAGEWRDHVSYALVHNEIGTGVLARWWRSSRTSVSDTPVDLPDARGRHD